MVKTILGYGIASLLAVSLLAGTGYILLNPTDAQAERNSIDGQEQGQGQGGDVGAPATRWSCLIRMSTDLVRVRN